MIMAAVMMDKCSETLRGVLGMRSVKLLVDAEAVEDRVSSHSVHGHEDRSNGVPDNEDEL